MKINHRTPWREKNGIIVPGRFADGSEINVNAGSMRGHFMLSKRNRYGQNIPGQVAFGNLITNYGLDCVGNRTSCGYCRVGTGTNAPAYTDTTLGAQVAYTSSVSANTAAGSTLDAYSTSTFTFTFTLGAINANLTEVGLGSNSSGSTLSCRAAIVDSNGDTTTFPVASDEQLVVTYIRGWRGFQSDIETTQTISGTSYDVVIRWLLNRAPGSYDYAHYPFGRDNNQYASTSLTALPSYGTSYSGTVASSETLGTYTSGSYSLLRTSTWAAGTATGTIYCVFIPYLGGHAVAYYQAGLVKSSAMILTLPFTISWGRA